MSKMQGAAFRQFATISKVSENDDGTIQVFGIASTECADAQGETVTKSAMTDAFPDYFKHGTGALRSMHQPIAAGFVTKAEVNAAGETEITATVVDPVEVLKVQTGVYKGFSIGGKKLPGGYDAATKTISKMKLTEISLVDRPANPEAVINMWKGDDMSNENEVPVVVSADAAAAVDALAEILNKGEVSPARLVELAQAEVIAKAKKAEDDAAAKKDDEAKPAKKDDEAKAAKKDDEKPAFLAGKKDAKKADEDDEADGKKGDKPAFGGKKAAPFGKADGGDDVQKSMYDVSRFAELIQSIGYLCNSADWELECENDDSKVPARMRAWLAEGVKVFSDMAAEEVAEFVAQYAAPAATSGTTRIALSDAAADLQKSLTAAAGVSLTEFLTIGKAHMAENDIAKAVLSDGFDKATAAIVATLNPEIAKLAEATDTIAKLSSERDELIRKVEAFQAMPAAGGPVLRVTVAKADDVVDPAPAASGPVMKADGSVDLEATTMQEIKKMHQSGGQVLRFIN